MHSISAQDDLLPFTGHCNLCGRYFDINEVNVGVFVHYFLLHRPSCPCPTCLGEQLHRVQDPTLQDVLFSRKFCDRSPNQVIRLASVWRNAEKISID
jgi:hypothetical protein